MCIRDRRYTGLTEEQKQKYRLLANKTGEMTGWDFSKLEREMCIRDRCWTCAQKQPKEG